MTSTLEQLCETIKETPSQISLLPKIFEKLIIESIEPESLSEILSSVTDIIKEYFLTVKSNKQPKVYELVCANALKYAEVLLQISEGHQSSQEVLEAYCQLVGVSINKKAIIDLTCKRIMGEYEIDWSGLRHAQILTEIFLQLKLNYTGEDQKLITFCTSIDHLNKIDFTSCPIKTAQPSQNSQEMREAYQTLMIQIIIETDQKQPDEQAKFYRKIGDKVISKFASPLILSEILLRKFKDHSQVNAVLQIQVLSCLFILVGKYQLQMEDFYQNLEKILTLNRNLSESLFRLKNSKRFLKLLESAMRSSRVPFKTILSITKLIIGQVYRQQSQFAFWALSFLVNLVKKHRQLQAHLNQMPELQCLKRHYSPRVRSLISELSKNLNKAEFLDIEQFGKVNCARLCQQKMTEISEKMEDNEYQIEFKIPNSSPFESLL